MDNKFWINLNNVDNIRKFANETMHYECDILVHNGNIDGRSLMGLFTLDLSKPIDVFVNTKDPEVIKRIKEKLKDIII